MSKTHAPACDRNRDPILGVIQELFRNTRSVLEIGSGTGQHAVYFGKHLPHLTWQTSDLVDNHVDINAWLEDEGPANVLPPLELDVNLENWPELSIDAVFSANAVHIMDWKSVQAMFSRVGEMLPETGLLVLYGPFNYQGAYTSNSNAEFDVWLKQRDPGSAIRNFEDLDSLASQAGMTLHKDIELPANNRILCWIKKATDN